MLPPMQVPQPPGMVGPQHICSRPFVSGGQGCVASQLPALAQLPPSPRAPESREPAASAGEPSVRPPESESVAASAPPEAPAPLDPLLEPLLEPPLEPLLDPPDDAVDNASAPPPSSVVPPPDEAPPPSADVDGVEELPPQATARMAANPRASKERDMRKSVRPLRRPGQAVTLGV
jgi:hypothetical protein